MKLLKTILYSFTLVALFLVAGTQANAARCTINDISFSPFDGTIYEKTSTLSISSENCEGGIKVKIFNQKDDEISINESQYVYYPPESGPLEIKFRLGEDGCNIKFGDLNDCHIFVEARGVVGGSKSTKSTLEIFKTDPSVNFRDGIIVAECEPNIIDGRCGYSNWELLSTNSATNENCKIDSVNFSPQEVSILNESRVTISIQSTRCYKGLYISPKGINENNQSVTIDIGDQNLKLIVPPRNQDLKIYYEVDEDGCFGDSDPFQCMNYLVISKATPEKPTNKEKIYDLYSEAGKPDLNKAGAGWLLGNCDGVCDRFEEWEFLGSNAANNANPVGDASNVLLKKGFNPNDPCYRNEEGKEFYDPNCYSTLAPIPGIGDEPDGSVIENLRTFQLGDYVNQLFLTALGILAVLAVIMIVIAGVQYMTVESFYGKTDARSRLTNAVLGLILALGIFTILQTINPELLDVNFGGNIRSVDTADLIALGAADVDVVSRGTSNPNYKSYIESSGIYCPTTGGIKEIEKIARSFENKTTYRLGGKMYNVGLSQPGYVEKDANNSCPISSNTLCLDCSGFTNTVLYCAGITDGTVGGGIGTFHVFSHPKSEDIENFDSDTKINGKELVPGDLVGYNQDGKGHIGIYIGDGYVAESTSSSNGRSTNAMIHITKTNERSEYMKKILRVKDIN
jgi:cell wall-associated NlpC family hydrolase